MNIKTILFGLLIIMMVMMPPCATPPTSLPAAETAASAQSESTVEPVNEQAQMEKAAKEEGELISYGMSDDWVNLGNIWKAIEDKYQIVHTDTDMTSAEQITRLMAEKNAPVMDMADIGYDFLGPLLENNLAMTYKNDSYETIPDQFKDPDGRWARDRKSTRLNSRHT